MRDFANSQIEGLVIKATGHAGLGMAFVALLSFLSPFGTYRFAPIERIGYWTLQMGGWVTLSVLIGMLVAQIPKFGSSGPAAKGILTTAIAAFPMLVITGFSNNIFHGWQPYPTEVIELYFSIMLIGGCYVFSAQRLLATLLGVPAADEKIGGVPKSWEGHSARAMASPSDPMLLDRLPVHLHGSILCMQVEDHYVRVHSSLGNAMVLMRFSDALRGLDHVTGMQVHRSWWVAQGAVTLFRRSGRTAQLMLTNEMKIPVSQPYVADAAARWGHLEAEVA